MEYKNLAEFYEEVSSTTKRLEKIKILSDFLKKIKEPDKEVMYLLLGDIYPTYDEKKIGISNQLTIKAISKATGIEPKEVVKKWKDIGDLGKVAEDLTKRKQQSTLGKASYLTTEKVFENLRKLPELAGKGTINKKLNLITELLISATPIEVKYLTRTLMGDLRIGLKEPTIRESLCLAFFDGDKACSAKVRDAIDRSNDLASVFEKTRAGKIEEIEKISMEVGKPIKAMLAQKAKTISDGFKALGKPCAIEYKYDGFRLTIHKKGKDIFMFTRRLENVTKQFPEVVEYIKKYVVGNSFILD